jgi:hypothetical protein
MPFPTPARVTLGVGLMAFVVAANAAFVGLIVQFDYDDVLRRPPAEVLSAFQAGGDVLIATWALFMLAALAFAPLALGVSKWLHARFGEPAAIATSLGVASAVLQAVGLSRWVFAIPVLAQAHAADPADADHVFMLYAVLNQFAGVAIGEHLGQMLLIGWTSGVALTLWRSREPMFQVLATPAALIGPAWLIGQTELYATVLPALPVIEAAPFAFMAWEVWILVLGAVIVWAGHHAPAPAKANTEHR